MVLLMSEVMERMLVMRELDVGAEVQRASIAEMKQEAKELVDIHAAYIQWGPFSL